MFRKLISKYGLATHLVADVAKEARHSAFSSTRTSHESHVGTETTATSTGTVRLQRLAVPVELFLDVVNAFQGIQFVDGFDGIHVFYDLIQTFYG